MKLTERQEYYDKFKLWAYYFLIGVVSLVSIVFLPMLGSEIDGSFQFPTTKIGWVIWITTRGGIAVVNVCLFALFKAQAKVNVRNEENFKHANEILNRYNKYKKIIPRSPTKYNAVSWGTKGSTLLISSLLSTFAFTEAVLKFDLICLLSYVFTIIVGLGFSYFTMRKDEDYYVDEYLQYAEMKEQEMLEQQKEINND